MNNIYLKHKIKDKNKAISTMLAGLGDTELNFEYQWTQTLVIPRYNSVDKFMSITPVNLKPLTFEYKGIKLNMRQCPGSDKLDIVPFMIGETEITQELFMAVMGFNPSEQNTKHGDVNRDNIIKRPVVNVSGYDCLEFCNRLSIIMGYEPYYKILNREGYEWVFGQPKPVTYIKIKRNQDAVGFRLPTEQEWTCAYYAWDDDPSYNSDNKEINANNIERNGWIGDNSNNHIHPVAQKLPNEWGIYDMIGNASELTDSIVSLSIYSIGCNFSDKKENIQKIPKDNIMFDEGNEYAGFRVAL
jgi:formylglycine-generating enzyme required for sulfatase activity